eukprot:PhM_4_TR3233/c0_g1_i1/m.16894/K09584/PDIA6, TXNDC7; protein disulfide-isomerase A6
MAKSISAVLFLAMVIVAVAMFVSTADALPFSKSSGVRELNGQRDLTQALKTHKPVFLLLYAPWCGHCKAIHPEYEKLAKSTDGVVDVLAVDADSHREVGGQFNLKGFPTVVYYGTDKKKWLPYNGERKAGAMTSQAMSLVEGKHVATLKDEEHLDRAFKSGDNVKNVAVLFTEKDRIPPLVQVLGYDPLFKGTVPIVVIKKKNEALSGKFSPEKYPAIAVLEKDAESGETKVKAWFNEKIKYDAIRAFVAEQAGIQDTGASSSSSSSAPKKPAVPKPALPVKAIEFTEGQMKLFCGADAPNKKLQQPFCAVAFVGGDDAERVGGDLYTRFENDPFVVFYSSDAAKLTKLGMLESPAMPSLVVFKAGKKGVRYAGATYASADELVSQGSKMMEKIAGGEMRMSKMSALPKL